MKTEKNERIVTYACQTKEFIWQCRPTITKGNVP
jgi:hypothetical protein